MIDKLDEAWASAEKATAGLLGANPNFAFFQHYEDCPYCRSFKATREDDDCLRTYSCGSRLVTLRDAECSVERSSECVNSELITMRKRLDKLEELSA